MSGLRWNECTSGTGVQGPVPDSVPTGFLELPSGAEVFVWERTDGYLVRQNGTIIGHTRDFCRVGLQNMLPIFRSPVGIYFDVPFSKLEEAPRGRHILKEEDGITYLEDGSQLKSEDVASFYSHVRQYFAPTDLVRKFVGASPE
jgi:hypothetical protein